MISLLSEVESHLEQYLTQTQFQTLSILISLINSAAKHMILRY